MSHFLTNLVLRSMGMAGTIMPRLPSLFEPSRLDSNLAVASGFFADDRDEEVYQQGTSASGAQALADHQRSERCPSVSDLPSSDFGKPETIKTGPGNQTGGMTVGSLSESLFHRTSLRSHNLLDGMHTPISAPKPSFIPESPRSESLPRSGRVQIDSIRSPTASPGHNEREAPDSMEELRFEHRSLPMQTKPHFSSSQARSQQYTTSQSLLPAALSTHSAPKAIGAVEPVPVPRRPVTGSAVTPCSNPSEPVIRVTIGRVEVRAIFPDAPVLQAQPAQSRRTLTLDEYLKRSSRGRR